MLTTVTFRRSLFCGCLVALAASAAAQTGAEVARAYREAHAPEIVRDFAEMLTYPNRAYDFEDVTQAAEPLVRDRAVGRDSDHALTAPR
jgi:hypothetical protein